MSNLSNNKRIAKNSVFMSIRMVIILGISLFTTRIVLRVLGVEDYGIFNVVAGFVSMFGFLNTSNGSKNRPLIPRQPLLRAGGVASGVVLGFHTLTTWI